MHVTAIIAAGGRGARLGGERPKQFLPVAGRPMLERSVAAFLRSDCITDLIVALPSDLAVAPPEYLRNTAKAIEVVAGGDRRRDSVARAFASVTDSAEVVVIHDAARPCVSPALIRRAVEAAADRGAAICAIPATDTVKRAGGDGAIVETIPRQQIFLAQTPQAFRVGVLRDALSRVDPAAEFTDEAALVERAGHPVHIVEGDRRNIKVTTPEDLASAERTFADGAVVLRIGNGYDLHRLVPGRPLVLGGVTIPFERGLDGHSDADAVCHAVTDAILGGAAAGDIGRHFPDHDVAWKDADSLSLLARAAAIVAAAGFAVANVDVVVIAQRPKLAAYVDAMRQNLARAVNVGVEQVSVKGKTNEGVDAVGAGDAIAVHAVALLHR